VNCAAIPSSLIASELFGHEKGAFTGATQRRLGRFELAEEGTLFLDEVGELPAETQITLLRVLQEHEFERVGGNQPILANVRLIAATNRDLEAAIAAGTFRSDLFYRLNVFPIEIPPLRERQEDIPLLVEYFIAHFARKAGKSFRGINKKLWTFFYRIRGQVIFVNCKTSLSVPSLYAKQKISPWTRVGFLGGLFPLSQKERLSSLTRLLPGRKRRLRLPCAKVEGECPDRPERLPS